MTLAPEHDPVAPRRRKPIEFTSVVLPTPPAEQAEDLPLLDLQQPALQHVGVAVVGVDVLTSKIAMKRASPVPR